MFSGIQSEHVSVTSQVKQHLVSAVRSVGTFVGVIDLQCWRNRYTNKVETGDFGLTLQQSFSRNTLSKRKQLIGELETAVSKLSVCIACENDLDLTRPESQHSCDKYIQNVKDNLFRSSKNLPKQCAHLKHNESLSLSEDSLTQVVSEPNVVRETASSHRFHDTSRLIWNKDAVKTLKKIVSFDNNKASNETFELREPSSDNLHCGQYVHTHSNLSSSIDINENAGLKNDVQPVDSSQVHDEDDDPTFGSSDESIHPAPSGHMANDEHAGTSTSGSNSTSSREERSIQNNKVNLELSDGIKKSDDRVKELGDKSQSVDREITDSEPCSSSAHIAKISQCSANGVDQLKGKSSNEERSSSKSILTVEDIAPDSLLERELKERQYSTKSTSLNSDEEHDSLAYGIEGFNHYRLYTTMEKKEKKKCLKKVTSDMIDALQWKQAIIDEIMALAKAYYSNPSSKDGREWTKLKSKIKNSEHSLSDVRARLAQMPEYPPVFTILIILTQIILSVTLFAVGGIASIGLEPQLQLKDNIKTFLGTETIHKWNIPNVWIGPSQHFFAGTGGMLAPCMRNDIRLQLKYIQLNYSTTEPLGCCEMTSRNTAGTTTEEECDTLTSSAGTWSSSSVCSERPSGQNFVAHILKPCCSDLEGSCLLTLAEHCMFIEGHFSKKDHCSQVNCMSHVCNMGGLTSDPDQPWLPGAPSQWWRLLLAPLIHHGVVHLLVVIIMQWLLFAPVERIAGWLRVLITYILTGVAGLLAASLVFPNEPLMGGSGTMFGMLAVVLVEMLQSWKIVRRPWFELLKLFSAFILMIFLGTLPNVSNFMNATGFVMGLFCAMAIYPYITFNIWQTRCRWCLLAVSVPCILLLMSVLLYMFYKVQTLEIGDNLYFFDCIPFTTKMCKENLDR